MNVVYSMTGSESTGTQILLIVDGRSHSINESHPNFDRIRQALFSNSFESLDGLLDVQKKVLERFGDNVTISGDTLMYKGEALYSKLANTIIDHYRNGWPVTRLVNFMERLMENPSRHSRTQLFEFLDKHDFTITEDGHFLAYKGIATDGLSITGGVEKVMVSGVEYTGRIPNPVGATVEMARTDVMDDPTVACSFGLHAGTWDYARTFGSVVVEVKIDPADVVSVPNDSNFQKIRTMRYQVIRTVQRPVEEASRYSVIPEFMNFLSSIAAAYSRKGRVADSYTELAERFAMGQETPLSENAVNAVFSLAAELDSEHTANSVYRYHIEDVLVAYQEDGDSYEDEEDYYGESDEDFLEDEGEEESHFGW